MATIGIRNVKSLINIFNVIAWLDDKRWNPENTCNYLNFCRDDLTNCEKILTHWLCYVTDRQMPFELIWKKGGYVFSEMVYEYSRSQLSPQTVLGNYYERYYDNLGRDHYRFKSSNGVTFASRYVTDDFQAIKQTLEMIDNPKYKRNIVAYIVETLRKFRCEEDVLLRVACSLHLLAYQLNQKRSNSADLLRVLNDPSEFTRRLGIFKKTSTGGKKRLWCCVRDYKKGLFHEIMNKGIAEICDDDEKLGNTWNQLPMDQIELPGDVWNNSPLFRDSLFEKVIDLNSVPKTWGMPKIIRELYNHLKEKPEIHGFYPEQFDITFDFVPRMCNKKLCKVCPFGPEGAKFVCIPTEEKFCPVALISCGYTAKCNRSQGNCLVREGIGKGVCKGIPK